MNKLRPRTNMLKKNILILLAIHTKMLLVCLYCQISYVYFVFIVVFHLSHHLLSHSVSVSIFFAVCLSIHLILSILYRLCLTALNRQAGRLTFVLPLPLLLVAARLGSGAGRCFALFGRARWLCVRYHLPLLLFSFLH